MFFRLWKMLHNDFIVTPNKLQGICQVSKAPSPLLLLSVCLCVCVCSISSSNGLSFLLNYKELCPQLYCCSILASTKSAKNY